MSLEHLSDFDLPAEEEARLRDVCEGRLDPETLASVSAWIRECYHRPSETELIMAACNELLEGFGTESLRGPWLDRYHQDAQASYVNMGDCCNLTIIRDHLRQQWLVTTVADLIETEPKRFR